APQSFIDYLKEYWMTDDFLPMWSAQWRKDQTVFEESDTNMLIEAWHHVLKSKFLEGKRNRRADFLVHILVNEVVPFYKLRERRQDDKFEGLDLEMKRRQAIKEK
ncbi:hypothetical protein C8J56DRAFT_714490, partial [Mycena floridula]